MPKNIAYNSVKYVAFDLIGDILYWPLWWYSKGLFKTAFFCLNKIKSWQEKLGVAIWIKNIFTPMFGQYDLEGRLISFFMRLFQIIVRLILLIVWTLLMLLILAGWIILPIIILYQIINNFIFLFR